MRISDWSADVCSSDLLSWAKAARFVGVGHVRALPVDADRRLPAAVLREAIDADRAAGRVPMIAVGPAGTANAGSIDTLAVTATACTAQAVWVNVFGTSGRSAAACAAETCVGDRGGGES